MPQAKATLGVSCLHFVSDTLFHQCVRISWTCQPQLAAKWASSMSRQQRKNRVESLQPQEVPCYKVGHYGPYNHLRRSVRSLRAARMCDVQ
jgi:hypothetical protein